MVCILWYRNLSNMMLRYPPTDVSTGENVLSPPLTCGCVWYFLIQFKYHIVFGNGSKWWCLSTTHLHLLKVERWMPITITAPPYCCRYSFHIIQLPLGKVDVVSSILQFQSTDKVTFDYPPQFTIGSLYATPVSLLFLIEVLLLSIIVIVKSLLFKFISDNSNFTFLFVWVWRIFGRFIHVLNSFLNAHLWL